MLCTHHPQCEVPAAGDSRVRVALCRAVSSLNTVLDIQMEKEIKLILLAHFLRSLNLSSCPVRHLSLQASCKASELTGVLKKKNEFNSSGVGHQLVIHRTFCEPPSGLCATASQKGSSEDVSVPELRSVSLSNQPVHKINWKFSAFIVNSPRRGISIRAFLVLFLNWLN